MMMMPWDLFGFFTVTQRVVKLNPLGYTQVVKQEPRRVVLLMAFDSNPPGFRLACSPPSVNMPGLMIFDGKTPLKFNNTTDGPLTQIEWTALSLTNPADMVVTEVLLNKNPCDK